MNDTSIRMVPPNLRKPIVPRTVPTETVQFVSKQPVLLHELVARPVEGGSYDATLRIFSELDRDPDYVKFSLGGERHRDAFVDLFKALCEKEQRVRFSGERAAALVPAALQRADR
jgi:hypothetical protein